MDSGDRRESSTRTRILIVDDNPLNALLCQTLLAREPCDVAVAADGARAIAAVAAFRPDLILMDLELPDTDGLTLARRILAEPGQRARVVALTAHAAHEVEAAVRDAGCRGLITKPLEPEAFLGAVRRHLAAAA